MCVDNFGVDIQIVSQGNFISTAPTSHWPVPKCDQTLNNANAPTRCLHYLVFNYYVNGKVMMIYTTLVGSPQAEFRSHIKVSHTKSYNKTY